MFLAAIDTISRNQIIVIIIIFIIIIIIIIFCFMVISHKLNFGHKRNAIFTYPVYIFAFCAFKKLPGSEAGF